MSVAAAAPAGPAAPASARPRFALVDAVRGLAALAVVATHANERAHPLGLRTAGDRLLTALGPTGVATFFVLSAFLLFRPFVAARADGRPRPSLRRFARRRVLRIVPAYWVALVGFALWPGLDGIPGPHAPSLFALGQVYRSATMREGLIPAWSLDVEIAFYALLLVVVALARPGWRAVAALAAGFTALRLALAAAGVGATGAQLNETLLGYLPWFLPGLAAAVLSVRAAPVLRRPGLWWAGAALAYAPVALDAVASDTLAVRTCEGLAALLVALPAFFAAGDDPGAVRRLLADRRLAWLGLVSYGIYLFHYPVIGELPFGALPAGPRFLALFAAGAALATALAAASFYGYERRVLRLGEPRR